VYAQWAEVCDRGIIANALILIGLVSFLVFVLELMAGLGSCAACVVEARRTRVVNEMMMRKKVSVKACKL
jgi:hypothetical protein